MNIIRNKLFICGCIFKLIIIFSFNSVIINNLFAPVIDYTVSSFNNPYSYFINNLPDAFPYPALMLYYLTLFKGLFFFLPTEIAIKFAILFADIIVLLLLNKILVHYEKEVLILYFLSPVLIYINFIHGQLDVIPIAFLFSSILFLLRSKYTLSMLFLGISIATKTSMVIVVPFILIYYYFNILGGGLFPFVKNSILIPLSFLLVNIPFLKSYDFYNMVFHNDAQNKLFTVGLNFGDHFLYFSVLCYSILVFQAIFFRIRTQDLFMVFISFAFGLIMVFIPPMPGWYYWIIPFWIYFFVSSSFRGKLLFAALQVIFVIYFAVIPASDYLISLPNIFNNAKKFISIYNILEMHNINPDIFINIILTILQSILLLNVFWIYKRGVDSFVQYKIISKPMLIGIGGNSGAGKSTTANAIINLFGQDNITSIKGDDTHKWERGNKNWDYITHLDPKANNLHSEYQQLINLKHGKHINRKHYDHNTGTFIELKQPIKTNNIILYDGLHPFYIKSIRDIFDIKIFIHPDEELSKYWKIQRDVTERGYSVEKVLEQIDKRYNDYKKYIKPQEDVADIIISVKPITKIDYLNTKKEDIKTALHIKCSNALYVEPFISLIENINTITVEHIYNNISLQELIIHGFASKKDIENIGVSFDIHKLGIHKTTWEDNDMGIIQLFLLYYIFEVMNGK